MVSQFQRFVFWNCSENAQIFRVGQIRKYVRNCEFAVLVAEFRFSVILIAVAEVLDNSSATLPRIKNFIPFNGELLKTFWLFLESIVHHAVCHVITDNPRLLRLMFYYLEQTERS